MAMAAVLTALLILAATGQDSGGAQLNEVASAKVEPTDRPSSFALKERRIAAIGMFARCTGTLIHPQWVLTAAHCRVQSGSSFCSGLESALPHTCSEAIQVVTHPTADISLVKILSEPGNPLSNVEPIPVLTEQIDESWIGRSIETAGYGIDASGRAGRRHFRVGVISSLQGDSMTIQRLAKPGSCYGDSGGPALVGDGDGSVRLAGHLTRGDPTCQGRDQLLRGDVYRDWVDKQVTGFSDYRK